MRSLELSLNKYDTDKVSLLNEYDPIFEPYVQKKIALLELGIREGGSLLLWRDYFPLGTIAGIDIKLRPGFEPGERIRIFEGSQVDRQFLSQVANNSAPEGFDIIIDDASHIGELTKGAFWHLFDNHLKPNGLYAIEDWFTAYWSDWPDGKRLNLQSYAQQKFKRSHLWLTWLYVKAKLGLQFPMRNHCYGMVGFVKQLVDEQAALRITSGSPKSKGKPTRRSKFEKMIITPEIVFIKKASQEKEIESNNLNI